MIAEIIQESSSKMGNVAPVVLEIFEKTGAYINRVFSKTKIFLAKNK